MKTITTFLAASLLVVTGCQSKSPPPVAKPDDKGGEAALFEAPPDQVKRLQIVAVKHQPVSRQLVSPALVAFDDLKTSDVTPLVSGKVAKLLVHEGDLVKVGQPLLAIASPDSSDNAAEPGARSLDPRRSKRAVLARDKDLYAHKAISLEELEGAELDVDATKASVDDDEAHINITGSDRGGAILHSPIAGIVVGRQVAVGMSVQAGATTSFTITDPSAVWVVLQLYQEDLRRVEIGDAATISSPVLDAPIDGKVIYIGASIDPTARWTIPVRISGAENPEQMRCSRKGCTSTPRSRRPRRTTWSSSRSTRSCATPTTCRSSTCK